MFFLSEITIKPGKSKVYLRLLLVAYFLTVSLVVYTSLYLLLKIIIICTIVILFGLDWINKCPLNGIQEIQNRKDEWILILNNGIQQHYPLAEVLIQNTLFLLIQFTSPAQKRLIVLFQDQLPASQLRLLYLKITYGN